MSKRLLLVAAALGVAVPAAAITTRTWTTASYRDFDAGEAERALITSQGEVMPGRATEKVDLGTESIWTAVRGPDGTIYAGGVTDGTIYAVSGKTKRAVASLFAETPWIGSLAIAGNTLYAGTLATGAVHAIDMKTGKTTKLATLGEGTQHVWALVLDPAGKTLWAATGPTGKLYAIDLPGGKARVIWDSGEKQLMSLARATDGALWVGTGDEALLYRFDPKAGSARAIADFAGSEVRAIVEVPGGFVVAANEFDAKSGSVPTPPPPKGPKGTPAKAPEAGAAPGADKPAPGTDGARTDARKGKGALFRVDADGRTEQLHALAEGYYQSLVATTDGRVYAASGSQGRVYVIAPDRTSATVFDVKERQVNAVLLDGANGLVFVTGDAGAVYRTTGAAKDAQYTSKVYDAQFTARWGNLRWRGAGAVLETRSGNTAKPGKGWSAWQKVASAARTGDGGQLGRVASPPGRYLQYKVSFDGSAGAVLRSVDVFFLPQNQRARVTEVSAETSTGSKAWVTLASGVSKVRSPILKLKWKTENPDDDDLVYTLTFRSEGDTTWGEIPTGSEPLTATTFDWNTETIADGYYRVQVTASDARANPAESTLTDSLVSPPILVDNQKPQVTGLAVKGNAASGRGIDSFSRIDEIAWQIDGGDWRVGAPQDGLFDDKEESFTLKLPVDLRPGLHTLTVRVADEGDNIGTQSVNFKIGK